MAASSRDGGVAADALRAFEEARWQRAARIGDTEAVQLRQMSAAVRSGTCAHAQRIRGTYRCITPIHWKFSGNNIPDWQQHADGDSRHTFLAATAAVRGGVQQKGCGGKGGHGRHCGRGGLHGVRQCTPAGPAMSWGCRRAQVPLQWIRSAV